MLEMARLMRATSPTTAVILLAEHHDEEWLFQAIKAGVAATVTRSLTAEELMEAIRKVSQGDYLINDDVLSQPALTSRALQSFREGGSSTVQDERPQEPCPLSMRETEVVKHIARGKSNKEIARLLAISDQTVKNHITSILRKLDVADRTAAVVSAIRQRWIPLA